MQYLGETIALVVAVMWTSTALCFEYASKKTGALPLNLIRLWMAFIMSAIFLYFTTGEIIPLSAGTQAWLWLAVSGMIGFVFGDFCLFNSYVLIGSRYTQLMMTLAPPSAAIFGALILKEQMNRYAILGMTVTLIGIIISIVGKDDKGGQLKLKLPLKGLLLAIGAGVGQGVGLVFSKLGMDYFQSAAAQSGTAEMQPMLLPFAASQIRIITGIIGFTAILALTGRLNTLLPALRQRKAMQVAVCGTFFGPFVGVGLSLMAVQFTQTGIASTLMALTPIFILVPSYFLYHQRIRMVEVAGAIISVIGVSLFFVS